MTTLGSVSLWLSVLLAAWGFGTSWIAGARRDETLLASAVRTPTALLGVLTVLAFSLAAAVVRQDFNLALVAAQTTRAMPPAYAFASIGRAPVGVLVIVAWALALGAAVAVRRDAMRASSARLVRNVTAAIAVAAAMLLVLQPFQALGYTPLEGEGLGAVARHPLTLVELMVAAGGVAALAVALATGRRPDRRVSAASVLAWVMLSCALAVRLWRQYAVVTVGLLEGGQGWLFVAWLVSGALVFRGPSRGSARRLAAAGVTAFVLGIVGAALTRPPLDIRLATGVDTVMSVFRQPFTLTSMGVSRFEIAGGLTSAATLRVRRGSGEARLLTTEQRRYFDVFGHPIGEPQLHPGVLHGLLADVRVVYLPDARPVARAPLDEITIRVSVQPLPWIAWFGLVLVALSGAVPGPRRGSPR